MTTLGTDPSTDESTTVSTRTISTPAAHRVIAAAEAKALEIGVPSVIAVCDPSGTLKALSRMDGAALLSVQVAQDKAYTAVGFGIPTDGWYDFVKTTARSPSAPPRGSTDSWSSAVASRSPSTARSSVPSA